MVVTFGFTVLAGKVILGGGSLQDDNTDVWQSFHQAAGGGTPKLVVLCSAEGSLAEAEDEYYNDTTDYWSWEHLFTYYGFDPVFIPIAVDNYQTAAYDQNLVSLVNSADAVWFNGGDQARHARCLLKDDGTDTPLMTAVRSVLNNGGVVGGSSAGAAIMGEYTFGGGSSYGYLEANNMIANNISDVYVGDPNNYDNGGYLPGFNFLSNIDACVDTHVGGRGRIGRTIVAMRELNNNIGIGVDENSTIIIDDNGYATVHGQYGVYIIDGTNASYPSDTHFVAYGLKAYSLSAGDSIDFSTMNVTSSKSLITSPYYSSAYESREIFRTDEVFKVMERLVDSSDSYVNPYSFDKKPRFYLEFSKNGDTKGYYDGKYTVDNLDLDLTWSQR